MDCKVNKITFFYYKSATAKINSLENWKYDQFVKINTREKSKFLQFAKINSREIQFFLTHENKYLRKLVLLRYFFLIFGPLKFVNYINKSFSEYNTLEAERCYLLGDFDINLPFKGKEIFRKKKKKKKKKIVLLYTFSVEQIITSPTRITDRKETCTCTDKIFLIKLTNQE